MRRLPLLLLPLAGLVLAGCGHTSSHVEPACCPAPHDARVSGALVGIGGPEGAPMQHWAGTVHARGVVLTSFRTDDRGHFSVALPAGTYRFTATSPSYDGGHATCQAAREVTLRSHRTTHVQVVCQLK